MMQQTTKKKFSGVENSKEGGMRKTIDLTDESIEAVKDYQQRNGLKNFSQAVRAIISNMGNSNMDKIKMDILNTHVAPDSAGEI